MSITPTGGWDDPTRRDDSPASVGGWTRGSQPSSAPRSSYLTCKVCDSGTLRSKSVFRMSGPVVAIGFILLVPSVIGVTFSALTLLGFNAVLTGVESGTNASESISRPYQSDFDAGFRKSCAATARRNSQAMGTYASQGLVEQFCECSMASFKETGSTTIAAQTCVEKMNYGTLEPLSPNVDAFYSSDTPRRASVAPIANLGVRVFGSGFIIAVGIASFVGGLLGWLLVMRKRVLQCDVCGAVVNAS
jgi:hypothetical protein